MIRQKPFIDTFPDPEPTAHRVDVVIPLGRGSRHGDAELRYCLRSIEKHLDGLGRVWIVGERPDWLAVDGDTLIHLPVPDVCPIADVSMLHKIGAACISTADRPRLADRFVQFCDDVLLLRPAGWQQLGPYHKGDLARQTRWEGGWWQRMKHTRDVLLAHGKTALNADGHLPLPMEREKFVRVLREADWRTPPGLCVGPLYFNWTGARMRPLGDRQVIIPPGLSAAEIRRRMAGRWFLCHMAGAFTPELRTLLDEIFPGKCRWERDDGRGASRVARAASPLSLREGPGASVASIAVRSAPTLSIIIPTIGRETLARTLASIRGQRLVEGDEVILVQDGPAEESTRRVFAESGLPGKYLHLDRRYADFGGTPRNRGVAEARGDYLASMDDDDTYIDNAFANVREWILRCPNRPLMFRIFGPTREKQIWHQKSVRSGNVGTTMFVTPNIPGMIGRWGCHRGQDFEFIHSTLAKWPPGSLVWRPEVIALYLRSSFTAAQIYARPMRRNLLYHVYPVSGNGEWQSNVAMLRGYWAVFNGRKVVGVAEDETTSPFSEVREAFADASIEWMVFRNDPEKGESLTFSDGASRLRSLDPDEITFYGHAKGVSRKFASKPPGHLASARRWRNFMYRCCLGDPGRTDRILKECACCGAMRTRGECYPARNDKIRSYWHFSGTYFWFNHAKYFERPLAGILGHNRFAVERHVGELFSLAESHCLAGDEWPGKKSPYAVTEAEWDQLELATFPQSISRPRT